MSNSLLDHAVKRYNLHITSESGIGNKLRAPRKAVRKFRCYACYMKLYGKLISAVHQVSRKRETHMEGVSAQLYVRKIKRIGSGRIVYTGVVLFIK